MFRQLGEDALHVRQEAHVEHAIGFIEHEDFDLRQIDRLLADVVEQSAGRGHDDVDAALQRVELRSDRDPAEDNGDFGRHVFAVVAHAFLDLCREFARRRQDQYPWRTAEARLIGAAKALQDRQHKGRRLAGAGLGAGHEVAARQHDRDRLQLNGCGGGVPEVCDRAYECLGQAEGFER